MNSIFLKKSFCLLMVLSVLIFTGCNRTYTYSTAQSLDNVDKVEICEYDYGSKSTSTIVVLDQVDAEALVNEINALECKRHFGDHTTSYGTVVIYISYKDGNAEVIGDRNVAQVDADGDWSIGNEYFDTEQFLALITKYVDAELLPDLSEYYDLIGR